MTLQDMEAKVIELGDGTADSQIILSIEQPIKDLVDNLAHRGNEYVKRIKKEDKRINFEYQFDEYPPELPTKMTGVLIHYFLKGVKQDFNVEFDKQPSSVRLRSSDTRSSSGSLTKDAKNEILAQQDLSFYKERIDSGIIDMPEVLKLMTEAYEKQKSLEDQGWYFTPEKTKPPYKVDSDKYNSYIKKKDEITRGRQQRGKILGNDQKSKNKK